jgi:hypothetical protein
MALAAMRPTHTHDCRSCIFIASIYMGSENYDAYVCVGRDPSVILRYGSEGPDYWSSPMSMVDRIAGPLGMFSDPSRVTMSGMGLTAQWVVREAQRLGHLPKEAA